MKLRLIFRKGNVDREGVLVGYDYFGEIVDIPESGIVKARYPEDPTYAEVVGGEWLGDSKDATVLQDELVNACTSALDALLELENPSAGQQCSIIQLRAVLKKANCQEARNGNN